MVISVWTIQLKLLCFKHLRMFCHQLITQEEIHFKLKYEKKFIPRIQLIIAIHYSINYHDISDTEIYLIDLLAIFINYQSAIIMDNMQESHNNYQSYFVCYKSIIDTSKLNYYSNNVRIFVCYEY